MRRTSHYIIAGLGIVGAIVAANSASAGQWKPQNGFTSSIHPDPLKPKSNGIIAPMYSPTPNVPSGVHKGSISQGISTINLHPTARQVRSKR